MKKLPFNYCTGCTACEQKCPNGSISMKQDNEGFLSPVINEETCLGCEACEKVCPKLTWEKRRNFLEAYGCTIYNDEALSNSTSGGFFYAIARYVLYNNGIVYGASYNDVEHVAHIRITEPEQLTKLQKSKYSQSALRNTFSSIKKDLCDGKIVLFSGTPCQIAGLHCFLGRDYETLLKIQVFCAEVVSPVAWKRYIEYLRKEFSTSICAVDTRCKIHKHQENDSIELNWKKPFIKVELENNRSLQISRDKDWFIKAFANHLISRKSCSNCDFKMNGEKIFGDISIGDFWGCENSALECFDESGVSAVIIHTEKGRRFFQSIQESMKYKRVDVETIFSGNPGIMGSNNENKNRNDCLTMLMKGDYWFDEIVMKSLNLNSQAMKCFDKIGLFGSYNTRAALALLCSKSNCSLSYQYSNSSLISLFSSPSEIPMNIIYPSNPYRKDMFIADFEKKFLTVKEKYGTVDYLVIDFLEERFDIIKLNNTYLTLSDAIKDSNYTISNILSRLSTRTSNLWYDSCRKFTDFLTNNFEKSKIILVKSYLSTHYENEDGSKSEFTEDRGKIDLTNKLLEDYYNYLKKLLCDIIDIEQPINMRYCEFRHKHGIYPWHANQVYYEYLCEEIMKNIIKNEKNS